MQRTKQQHRRVALQRVASLLVVVIVSFAATGCSHARVIAVIQTAITQIETESENWETVVRDMIDELDRIGTDLSDKIKRDAESVMRRTLMATSEEVMCTSSFFGNSILGELHILLAKAKGDDPPKRTARFCLTDPTSVDLAHPPQTIEVSGYNFDAIPPVEVYARPEASPSNLISLTPRLTRPSHHHLTLDVSPRDDFVLDERIDRIIFQRNEQEKYDLAVIPQRCQTETRTIPVGTHLYVQPELVDGDKDFFGKLDATITVRLIPASTYIDASIEMIANETPGDTEARGQTQRRIFTAPGGTLITDIRAPMEEVQDYHDGDEDPAPEHIDYIRGTRADIVNLYRIHGDRYGNDIPYTDVDAELNQFEVQVIQNEGCRS
jgi:hypothetical protein